MSTNLLSRARVPTPKQLSSVGVRKDEFETFWHILITYCQQDSGYLEFFPGGKYEKWQALSTDPTRGIVVSPEDRIQTELLQIAKLNCKLHKSEPTSILY